MLVILKLIETGARRREKHNISGLRAFGCELHGTSNRARMLHRNGAFELWGDFLCSRTNQ